MNKFLLLVFFMNCLGCYSEHLEEIRYWDTFWVGHEQNLPAKIHLIRDEKTDDFIVSLLEDGLYEWNYNLQGKYFEENIELVEPEDDKECNTIYIQFIEEMPPGKAGLASVADNCYFYIRLTDDYRELGSYELLYGTFMHELGHSLGLHHNSDEQSVMFKKALPERGVTQADIDNVHSNYPLELIQ